MERKRREREREGFDIFSLLFDPSSSPLSSFRDTCALKMWSFALNSISSSSQPKKNQTNHTAHDPDCSDDDFSSSTSREEGLECPICWESFNIVENVPYVLWCGHTLCKNCVLGLQWAVVKLPTMPIQLPLFVSCPWCNLLSFRFVYNGNLKFPRKNYFLLWMVESMNGDRKKSHSYSGAHQPFLPFNARSTLVRRAPLYVHQEQPHQDRNNERQQFANYMNTSLRKSLAFFVNLTAKLPHVIIFLLIVVYAVPASLVVLLLYVLVTILFALPSFLILYFAYPSLVWLVREIIT